MTDYSRDPRPSTDEEHAPLLRGEENGGPSRRREYEDQTLVERVNAAVQEPLTPLTKILLILSLVLLLLSSVFIGLFAGAQHKLNTGRGKPGDPGHEPITTTETMTRTWVTTTTEHHKDPMTTTATVTTTVSGPPVPGPTTPPHEKPCMEPRCIVLAASILSSIDGTKDPCDSFYDYANTGWLKEHPLPGDKSSFSNFEDLAQKNRQLIRQIIEAKPSSVEDPHDRELLTMLHNHYSSCLNEDRLNKLGEKPLLHVVKTIKKLYREEDTDIRPNPPSDEDDTKPEFRFNGLTAATAFLHSRDIAALFSFDIEGDVAVDPNYMALWFSQPDLGLPSKEYYNEESIVKVYGEVIEQLLSRVDHILADSDEGEEDSPEFFASLLINNDASEIWPPWPWPPWNPDDDPEGEDPKKPLNRSERVRRLAKGVVEFESKLANASLDLDILYQDPIATYNPVPLSNLTKTLHQFDFPTYFSTFTPRAYPDRVILTYPSYAKSLADVLNSTSSDVVEAYLVSRAMLTLSPYLGPDTVAWQAQRVLYETLTGIQKGVVGDRAEYCVGRVEETLGFASGRYFVQKTFSGDSKSKATKVIKDIVQAFKHSLEDLDWMDDKSAKAAAEKADAIRINVGYPVSPDTMNPRSLARYYGTVKISKDTFFENMMSASSSEVFKKWLQLGKQRNREKWEMFPSTVNAYFNPPANEMNFPAGILQPPFYSQDWPGYLSYGAFGHVAAHELTHAFDSAGRMYNQDGKLEQWWTDKTSKGFNKKQKCIVDQFSKYKIDDGEGGHIHVNGNLTSGENIGDTGLIQAYRAWKAQYEDGLDNGTEYALPGLSHFTREQLFFLSFARIWARNMRTRAAVQRIRTDPHSPARFRVDGTLSNIPEFAKAFNCPKGSKLNPPPEKRCIFWG
ncbi:endothelin-converting enzyme 1 [Coprinopsis cinerea okayama7|uniref:Endothelin-converting enzyme 1 n=1 Tax=Coprinopsis cinerea (strain Okayama-7 / 130 / ATCC MYA-4618 / FGSC 9003) TaxID=240176 RepID=D6RKP2_COPC7|nr:endothelin-converting enzyme 1 [Coprinopsis cinerea okayama7\|eukprot:XP_002911894.1 endothelin-converting enzyme 1 [Coprinopsis cinerea okayama7\